MKVIFRNTTQRKPYADSHGEMLVLLEKGDIKEEVIKEVESLSEKTGGWSSNTFVKELSEYTLKKWNGEEIIKGRLLLFNSWDRYTG